jgi:hypothetical protein
MRKDDGLKVQFLLTAPVIVSYPQVFEARAYHENGKPKGDPFFQARLVFRPDHPDLGPVRTTVAQLLAKVSNGADLKTLRLGKDYWHPITSGDALIAKSRAKCEANGRDYGGWEDYMSGHTTLLAKAMEKYPPQLDYADQGRWVKVNPATDKDRFFSGMEALGGFALAASRKPNGDFGVSCYLNGLAATGGGTRTGGNGYNATALPSAASFGHLQGALADRLNGGFELPDADTF